MRDIVIGIGSLTLACETWHTSTYVRVGQYDLHVERTGGPAPFEAECGVPGELVIDSGHYKIAVTDQRRMDAARMANAAEDAAPDFTLHSV